MDEAHEALVKYGVGEKLKIEQLALLVLDARVDELLTTRVAGDLAKRMHDASECAQSTMPMRVSIDVRWGHPGSEDPVKIRFRHGRVFQVWGIVWKIPSGEQSIHDALL